MSERIEIEFGSRVRKLREEAGLSSREFALMIGRSKAYIIQLENGHRNVSLDTIERIAAGLGISLTDLFKNLDTHVEVSAIDRSTPPPSAVIGSETSSSRHLPSTTHYPCDA